MAFDGAFLSCLKEELESTLIEARVDKIHQPSREGAGIGFAQPRLF